VCDASVKVSIIIPVYNEMPTLGEVLRRVLAAPLPAGCEREVIVVDDGSTDGTRVVLEEFQRRERLLTYYSAINEGKGAALRVGIGKATGSIILVQDGDLEYDPADYVAVLTPIVSGTADIVYGSRFSAGPGKAGHHDCSQNVVSGFSRTAGMRWPNWIANRLLALTANVLFDAGISDEATAYKAFRADVLRRVTLTCRRFEFCPEVTAKLRRLGYRIQEVPISYHPRSVEQGKKIRYSDGFEAFWTLVRFRVLPRRRFEVSAPARSFGLAPAIVARAGQRR